MWNSVWSTPKLSAADDDDDVPPGFEHIDTPRETRVEVWNRGYRVGTAQAVFTSSWIRFKHPENVVRMLPELVDQKRITSALTGQLGANREYLCQSDDDSECRTFEPEIAGVVLDARYFRVDVFVNPGYLKIRRLGDARYLSEASSGFSAVQGLSLSMSGARSEDSTDHFSWYGRSVMAFHEKHVFSDWTYDKAEHFNISSLYLEQDLRGQELQGGLFGGKSFGLTFAADPTLLGARIAHSSETLAREASLNTTPLIVYLPVRGRVEIYRDNKLLDAILLESGRQQIDTRRLPQGAYNLTIKVFDGTRLVDEQRKLFVKSNQLPGRNDPIYFLEFGRPMETTREQYWPRTREGWVIRGGYSFLLWDSTALNLATAAEDSDVLVEAGFLHLSHNLDLSGGVMASRHRRQGFYGEARWRSQVIESRLIQSQVIQLQGSYRMLNKKKGGESGTLLDPGSRVGQFTLSSVLKSASIELGRDWKKNQGDRSSTVTDHLRVDWPLRRGNKVDLRLSINGSRTRGRINYCWV